jgi:hypothetical protein
MTGGTPRPHLGPMLAAVAAVAALLAAGVLFTTGTGGSGPAPADRASRGADAPEAATAAPVARGGLAASPVATAGEPARSPDAVSAPAKRRRAVLDVEVVDSWGAPVGGATVLAYGTYEWDRLPDATPNTRAQGLTDAAGRILLEVPVAASEATWPGPVVLHAWSDAGSAVGEPLDPWAPDPAEVARRAVRLALREGVTVSGTVTSDAGRPTEAEVRLTGRDGFLLGTSSVAPAGAYGFPPVPRSVLDGATVTAIGRERRFASATTAVAMPTGRRVDVPIVVGETVPVTGRLVDVDGRSVRDVSVVGAEGAGVTSLDGEFEVHVPRRGGEVRVLPKPPFSGRVLPVRPLELADLGDVVLERGGRIRGRIELGFSFPAKGPGWPVECENLALQWATSVRTEPDGSFEVVRVGPGEHVVRASWGTHDADVLYASGEVRGVLAGDEHVVLRVERCGHLEIDARTVGGEPAVVRGWRVEATGPLPDGTVTVRTRAARARDLHDEFVVGVPRPGRYRLRVHVPGYAPAEREEVLSDAEPVRLVLPTGPR